MEIPTKHDEEEAGVYPDLEAISGVAIQQPDVKAIDAWEDEVCYQQRDQETTSEASLRHLWAQALNLDAPQIGSDVTFLQLGGDSIRAIKLVNLARPAGLDLQLSDVMAGQPLSELAAKASQSHANGKIDQIKSGGISETAPLSPAQSRLWFLDQLGSSAKSYNVPLALRIQGPLNTDALSKAIDATVKRHEILRTVFQTQDDAPVQSVLPQKDHRLGVRDINHSNEIKVLSDEQAKPFQLSSEAGFRAVLFRYNEMHHILSLVMHHIAVDGWSIQILCQELGTYYSAAVHGHAPLTQMTALPIQYRDFARWQAGMQSSSAIRKELQYWTKQLADAKAAELPLDHVRPTRLSGEAGVVSFSIDRELYRTLQSFARLHEATMFHVLLTAFRSTHYRLTYAVDATIGIPNANRSRPELQDLIGFFVNTECLRLKVTSTCSFRSLLDQVRAVSNAALANQDVPFEKLVAELVPGARDTSRNPLVQLMFAVHGQSNLGEVRLEGLEVETITAANVGLATWTRFDMEFHLHQKSESYSGTVLFAPELFERSTIVKMVDVFLDVLREGMHNPDESIATLPLGRQEDSTSIVHVFKMNCAAYPDSIAVRDPTTQLTYHELDRKSTHLASFLVRKNLRPETTVGIFANRSCEYIVAILGILKANCAYLPLDVLVPAQRHETILATGEGETLVLLGENVVFPQVKPKGVTLELVRIMDAVHGGAGQSDMVPLPLPSADSLAYVMYTSGSTGTPKGVMVEHRGVVRLVKESNVTSPAPPRPRVAHLSNPAFDASTWEIYSTLLNGGTLICIDHITVLDTKLLAAQFVQESIQAAMLTPALLKRLMEDQPAALSGLELLFAAGDRFDPVDAKNAKSLVRGNVFNAYGPTENTCLSTIYCVDSEDVYPSGVPIGFPVSKSGALVMDSKQRPVPSGVLGELVVTGIGLARGYTDQSLDKDRFIIIDTGGTLQRAYRTGDLVRQRISDCALMYIGRLDGRVKIRGQLVDTAEVEHFTQAHVGVSEAAVVAYENSHQETELAAFVTASADLGQAKTEHEPVVDDWSKHFDDSLYTSLDAVEPNRIGRDFLGWVSMIHGSAIDESDMQEWLEDTMQNITNDQPAKHILEIGCGTGMVLFNLGDEFLSYTGIDPSPRAVAFVSQAASRMSSMAGKVAVRVGHALEIASLRNIQANVIAANSVIQYFPSLSYLEEVIARALALRHVERIVLGDVRSYPLWRHFLAEKAMHNSSGQTRTMKDLKRQIAQLAEEEEELLVDPAYFSGLQTRFPDLVEHVAIFPKAMGASNELSAYRYTAVIYRRRLQQQTNVHHIERTEWIDFAAEGMDSQSLGALLSASSHAPWVAVGNIPYSKIAHVRHLVDSLDDAAADDQIIDQSWSSSARQAETSSNSMAVVDLKRLAADTGFDVEVSWARQRSQIGALDAVFHRLRPSHGAGHVLFNFPVDPPTEPLATTPAQWRHNRELVRDILRALEHQLPSYMVPASIKVLAELPLNLNAKVDRQKLAELGQRQPKIRMSRTRRTQAAAPKQGSIAAVLCEEVSTLLGVHVNINDNFFELGGHSLMATRLSARISKRFKISLSVRSVFECPTLAQLGERIEAAINDDREEDRVLHPVPFELLPVDNAHAFIGREFAPQLTGVSCSDIVDAYSATYTQEVMLIHPDTGYPRPSNAFWLDLPAGTDHLRLRTACDDLVRRIDILRSTFLRSGGKHYHVLLKETPVLVRVFDAVTNLDEIAQQIYDEDKSSLCLGEPFADFAILQNCGHEVRLILRISHALYDLPTIKLLFQALDNLCHGLELQEVPSFAYYVRHMQSTQQEGYAHWRSVLKDSTITKTSNPSWNEAADHADRNETYQLTRTITVPSNSTAEGITQATIFTLAWAMVLARETQTDDVLFGRVVSGRTGLPSEVQGRIFGPCINVQPVRVQLNNKSNNNTIDLLKDVQAQYTNALPFETIGLQDIRDRCTNWPKEDPRVLSCFTLYQNPPELLRFGDRDNLPLRAHIGAPTPTFEIDAVATADPDGQHLHLFINAYVRSCSRESVERMMGQLYENVLELSTSSLAENMGSGAISGCPVEEEGHVGRDLMQKKESLLAIGI